MDNSIQEMLSQLIEDGVVSGSQAVLKPLSGGVSSEIYLVTDQDCRFVVKRALHKLKVEADWFADVSRNESEYDYIDYVSKFAPENVPHVLAKGDGYFAMEHLGDGFDNWKQLLLDGTWKAEHGGMAGSFLADVHNTSRGDGKVVKRFNNDKNFWDLRLDPYLVTTGNRNPDLRPLFHKEAERLSGVKECLVHGDFSPKNMLVSRNRMVVLDCEVANFGDPAFDFCFLLCHLLLKALWHSRQGAGVRPLVDNFSAAYHEGVAMSATKSRDFSLRSGRLLAMLLLARVDGKSPVEYLTDEPAKKFVRRFVTTVLRDGGLEVDQLIGQWFAKLP